MTPQKRKLKKSIRYLANYIKHVLAGTQRSSLTSHYITFGAPYNSKPIPLRTIRISDHPSLPKNNPENLWANLVITTRTINPALLQTLLEEAVQLRFPWRKTKFTLDTKLLASLHAIPAPSPKPVELSTAATGSSEN